MKLPNWVADKTARRLLRAVAAQPENDFRRRALAARLEKLGDTYGAFLRATVDADPSAARLLRRHAADWLFPVTGPVKFRENTVASPTVTAHFDRGMVSLVVCEQYDEFFERAEEFALAFPLARFAVDNPFELPLSARRHPLDLRGTLYAVPGGICTTYEHHRDSWDLVTRRLLNHYRRRAGLTGVRAPAKPPDEPVVPRPAMLPAPLFIDPERVRAIYATLRNGRKCSGLTPRTSLIR